MCHIDKRPLHTLNIVSYDNRGKGACLLIVDFLEYKAKKQLHSEKPKEKPIPIIKIFKVPLNDTNPFHYTEIKKDQK